MYPKAAHLDGGNYFDKMLIDIQSSIQLQEEWLNNTPKKSMRKSRIINYLKKISLSLSMRLNIHEPMVLLGIKRKWFNEFLEYWRNCLGGRPLDIMDFHSLHFSYRKKFQYTSELSWNDAKEHLSNWQTPNNIYTIFHFVKKYALRPVREARFHRLIKPGMKVLEYGCSLAPMYRTYRTYFNHLEAEWYLADIPVFPFHYARHVYGQDKEVKRFICITEDKLDDPLRDIQVNFDLIIVQEVFEHLHKPLLIAEYFINRLNPGGFFYFDFSKSSGKGLDTQAGMKERIATLQYLDDKLEIISGSFSTDGRDISTCIGRKK